MSQIDLKSDFSSHTPAIIECCQTCRYFQQYPSMDDEEEESEEDDEQESADFVEEDYTGVCRRYPPKIFPGITPISVYPDVSGRKGWCGEYTPGLPGL